MTEAGDIIQIPGSDPSLPWVNRRVVDVTSITIWIDEPIPGKKKATRKIETGYMAIRTEPA